MVRGAEVTQNNDIVKFVSNDTMRINYIENQKLSSDSTFI